MEKIYQRKNLNFIEYDYTFELDRKLYSVSTKRILRERNYMYRIILK